MYLFDSSAVNGTVEVRQLILHLILKAFDFFWLRSFETYAEIQLSLLFLILSAAFRPPRIFGPSFLLLELLLQHEANIIILVFIGLQVLTVRSGRVFYFS